MSSVLFIRCGCGCGEVFEPRRANQKFLNQSHREKMRNLRTPVKRLSEDQVTFLNAAEARQEPNPDVVTMLHSTNIGQTSFPALLTETEASQILRIAPATLKDWRARPSRARPGPNYIKVGKRIVRYAMNDLVDWLVAGTVRQRTAA